MKLYLCSPCIRGSTVCKDSKKKSRAAIDKVWKVSEKVVQKWLNTRPEKVKIQILMKSQEIANKFYINPDLEVQKGHRSRNIGKKSKKCLEDRQEIEFLHNPTFKVLLGWLIQFSVLWNVSFLAEKFLNWKVRIGIYFISWVETQTSTLYGEPGHKP